MISILGSSCTSFFSGVPCFLGCLVTKLHINHSKSSIIVLFNLQFFYIILPLSESFMNARHGGSSKSAFIIEVFVKILVGAQEFFILHSKVQFFLFYLLRWCYIILDNFSSCFMIHKLSGLRYLNPSFSLRSRDLLNPSISLLELSWVIFHLKPSLRNVAIVVIINGPSYLSIILVEEVFHLVGVIMFFQ